MTTLIYAKLPFEQIHYIERPEFHSIEKVFKSRLLESVKKTRYRRSSICRGRK